MKYILISTVIMCIGACGVCNSEDTTSIESDSTLVKDTTIVDTTAIDTNTYQPRP